MVFALPERQTFRHFYKPSMENSKWVKLAPKEDVLKLKEQEGFNFCISNLCKHFSIPDKRMGELLIHYDIEVMKLTKNVKLTTEQWITECIEQHGSHYDYSKSIYINSKTPITIGCPVHGDITVNPNRHKNGGHCKRCAAKEKSIFKPLSKEEYIQDALITHKGRYDYSLVEDFKTVNDKITIICPVHGAYQQHAHSHRKGSGCEKCSYIQRGEDKRVSFQEFLALANEKFKGEYEYIESTYTKMSSEVTYICKKHGRVSQIAGWHLLNNGCSECFKRNERHTTQSFIEKALEKHNSFYTYEKTEYGSKNTDKVIITCPFHGDFEQAPMGHLAGAGCKTCANIKSNLGYSNLSKEDIESSKLIPCKLYLLKFTSKNMEYYKIGISTSYNKRLNKLRSSHKASTQELYVLNSNLFDCATIEGKLFKEYKKYNKKGEVPFYIEGSTECFSINTPIQEIIDYLNSI